MTPRGTPGPRHVAPPVKNWVLGSVFVKIARCATFVADDTKAYRISLSNGRDDPGHQDLHQRLVVVTGQKLRLAGDFLKRGFVFPLKSKATEHQKKTVTCNALMTALSSSTMTESSREKRSPALDRSFLSST